MKHPISVYQLTDAEKAELIEKVSQDITFESETEEFENDPSIIGYNPETGQYIHDSEYDDEVA